MDMATLKRLIWLIFCVFGLWIVVEYLLILVLPFLLGGLLAYGAEPLIKRVRLPRPLASGVGVTLTLLLFGGALVILVSFVFRELMALVQNLPDIRQTAATGAAQLEGWLLQLSGKTPKSIRPLLTGTVQSTFQDTSALMGQLSGKATAAVTSTIGRIPKVVLTAVTAVIAAFMISGRLPQLRASAAKYVPQRWKSRYMPALRRMKTALWGWVKAQLKLAAVTWGIVSLGFLLLKIPYGVFWAVLIALVDAVPVLGTGTVLIPWSLISFLQNDMKKGIGLLLIYGIALLCRTVLEPRFVGQQLGLDPLWTLVAFYVGFTLWGIGGMLLAPVLATAAKAVLTIKK